MIKLENISFAYGKQAVLKNICLSLEPGKIYAVIGPNGSGKTTLIKLLSSLLKPKNGELNLDGKPYGSFGRKDFAKQVALLPQGRNTPDISVYDLVSCGRYPYLDISRKLTEADKQAVSEALIITDTERFADRNVKKLSGGERQRVYMAMLYAQNTPYVLLDEPTTHLDISYGFQIMNMLMEMKMQGKCVVAVLHDLNFALKFADEVILMKGGEIISSATPEETVASKKIQTAFGVSCEKCFTESGETEFVFKPYKGTRNLPGI